MNAVTPLLFGILDHSPLANTPWRTRAAAIRAVNSARFHREQAPGECHFNTHHQVYQAALEPHGTPVSAEAWLVEMDDAQFERRLDHLRQLRALARRGTPA